MLNRALVAVIFAITSTHAEEISAPQLVSSEAEHPMVESDAAEMKIRNEYFKFVAEHGKQYASKEHLDERYAIFKENYSKIQEHNNQIDDEGRSPPFELGVNQFSDMTEEEFMADRFGAKIPERLKQKKRLQSVRSSETRDVDSLNLKEWNTGGVVRSIPDYKNWYEEGLVTQPYDQGSCGSCWAFSAASTLESLAKLQGHDIDLQEYSVQQLMDCDKQNFECTGGWMYEAYEYTQEHGIMLKGQYSHSYAPRSLKCAQTNEFHFKNTDMGEHDGMTNDEIREMVMQQPIGAAMYSTGLLQSYKNGIITEDYLHCSKERYEVNHGIVIVGFGTHTNETVRGHCNEYWIIRNSWGRRWGEDGFFKLCADDPFTSRLPYGTCHINEYGTWPL